MGNTQSFMHVWQRRRSCRRFREKCPAFFFAPNAILPLTVGLRCAGALLARKLRAAHQFTDLLAVRRVARWVEAERFRYLFDAEFADSILDMVVSYSAKERSEPTGSCFLRTVVTRAPSHRALFKRLANPRRRFNLVTVHQAPAFTKFIEAISQQQIYGDVFVELTRVLSHSVSSIRYSSVQCKPSFLRRLF